MRPRDGAVRFCPLLFVTRMIFFRISPSMPARSTIYCAMIAGLTVFFLAFNSLAQTATNSAADALPPRELSESDLFFREYDRAARLVEQGARNEAAIIMTLLVHKLESSPWLEIATLKLAELNENSNPQAAMDGYDLILKRAANAPYFQKDPERGRFFAAALTGATEQGQRRIRLRRIRQALDQYFIRHQQYPENLAKLTIFNFIDAADILDVNNRPFRYLPTGQQFRPQIIYLRYELEIVRAEPFAATTPRLETTTRLTENPETYAARIEMPGRVEPIQVKENQTIEGYYVATIARSGIILCTADRILVIPVRN